MYKKVRGDQIAVFDPDFWRDMFGISATDELAKVRFEIGES